jgi:hypothetical protein
MIKKWIKPVFAAIIFAFLMVSCEYEFIEAPAPPPPPVPGDTTSFANDVLPIFENANCTNCHNGGGLSLDLTPDNAFNSIYDNNLVVPTEPEASVIYTYPHPVNGTHNTKYSSVDDANELYNWILEGALDN